MSWMNQIRMMIDMIHVEANQFSSRRTRNHINRGLQALRLNRSRDLVLLGDENGKPMAWVPVNEVRELPKWMENNDDC